DVTLKMPAFEWVHVQLHQQKGMISLSPPTICNSARKTVEQLAALDIRVHCLALGGVDLTSPAGKMTMQVISAVAEFERDLLLERTYSGIARAKAAGKRFGRPPILSEEQKQTVTERLNAGISISAIAREFNTTRQTILRVKAGLLQE
ncbi:recombinase family protein, partial [Enterobacter cloacae]|uniref:recombinase family protein n=1 Tax=Enterobacter cloacae TaxID=550 RepID=UPI002B1F2D40